MASTEVVDPYLDPETGLLRNLVGARDHATLVAAEGALVFARAIQLLDQPPESTSDLRELRAIHLFLFQDIFDWAGQIRVVDIRKKAKTPNFFPYPYRSSSEPLSLPLGNCATTMNSVE